MEKRTALSPTEEEELGTRARCVALDMPPILSEFQPFLYKPKK